MTNGKGIDTMVLTKKDIKDLFDKEQSQYPKVEAEDKKLGQIKMAHKDNDAQDQKLNRDNLFLYTMSQMKKDLQNPEISNDSECLDEDKVNLDNSLKWSLV